MQQKKNQKQTLQKSIIMQSNKNKQPNSKLKSIYLSCRNHLPCSNSSTSTNLAISPIPISKKPSLLLSHDRNNNYMRSTPNFISSHRDNHGNESVDMQWQRVNKLERELVEVEEWLGTELARLKRHLKVNNNKTNCDQRNNVKFGRLDNGGGYVYSLMGMKVLNEGCQDLIIQFSSPSLVPLEIGSNISKVLNQMAAMGKENLLTWLLKSMPMINISTNKTHKIAISPCNTPNGLLEAIMLKALKKLDHLVIEGLRIQMGVKEVIKQKQDIARRRSNNHGEEKFDDHEKDEEGLIIMAMLIQPRNPQMGYEAMNEMMIGFVEVQNSAEDETGFCIKGVHVAGLVARKRNGQVIHNCLWYVSG